ncbi:MAG: ribosome-associated translation inhibitor RaiA [Patescibacteria group bacterium]
MKVLVEGKNLEVTGALRKHAEQQATKLGKIGKKIIEVRVFLETIAKKSNDPHANRAIFSVSLPGAAVVVRKEAADMYEAIVDAAHATVRQVRKRAEKRVTKSRRTQDTDLALGV